MSKSDTEIRHPNVSNYFQTLSILNNYNYIDFVLNYRYRWSSQPHNSVGARDRMSPGRPDELDPECNVLYTFSGVGLGHNRRAAKGAKR